MFLNLYTSVMCTAFNFRAHMRDRLVDLTGSEAGGVAAEYAILIALIAIVIAAGAAALGIAINNKLNNAASCVNAAPC
jgi:Flp pilus assembly pilin Flp